MASKEEELQAYWKRRNRQAERVKDADFEAISKRVNRIYNNTRKSITTEIEAFYSNYANKNGITKREAKKRASDMDVQAFADKAAQYVREKDFSAEANAELSVYNLEMKVNRLELLQYNIDLEVVALGNAEEKLNVSTKSKAFVDELREQAGILGLSVPEPERVNQLMQAFLNKPYEGAQFSERIWGRTNDMRIWLSDNLPTYVLKGQNPRDMIGGLVGFVQKEYSGNPRYAAERLAITEYGYIQTEAQRLSYEEVGTEMYNIITESKPCDICQSIAGAGPYKVSEMDPGSNAPMFHPFCKCGTAPAPDREGLERMFSQLGL